MKRLSKIFLINLLAAISIAGGQAIHAGNTKENRAGVENRIKDLDEMTNEELIASIETGRYSEMVKKFQQNEARTLLQGKYNPKTSPCNVETMRNREVLIVTIPADRLFMPNDTTLRDDAAQWLQPLRRYTRRPDMYRMLLVMHSDDTGSEAYTDRLTLSRVDAVFDWMSEQGWDTRYVFPTASGSSDPRPGIDNTSMTNRAANRRLEIYLIPGKAMVEMAREGRISL